MTVLEALQLYLEYEADYCLNNESNIRKELKKFIYQDFIPERIMDLTLHDYCIGKKNVDSFCYRIERGPALSQYGSIRGVSSMQYNVWFNQDTDQYLARIPHSNKITHNVDEVNKIFEATKAAIVETISSVRDDIHKGDFTRYNEASKILYDNVQSKIAFLYDSERETPVYSYSHLAKILTGLGVTVRKGRLQRRMDLFDYYDKEILPKFPNVTPYIFMCFIYNEHYGFTNEFLSGTAVEEERATHPSPFNTEIQFDVEIVTAYESEEKKEKDKKDGKESDTGSPRLKTPANSQIPNQDKNNETGKKGEEFVRQFLNSLMGNGKITNLTDNVALNKDRTENCDFEFDHDSHHVYVDVKATSYDTHDHVVFYITAPEYRKLEQYKDHYYIFYVNDVDSKVFRRNIRIVSYDSINENKEEVAYYVNFKCKKVVWH